MSGNYAVQSKPKTNTHMEISLTQIFFGGVAFGAGNAIGNRAGNAACDFSAEKIQAFKAVRAAKKAEENDPVKVAGKKISGFFDNLFR